ncbi:hypothetical protein UFOVP84_36 [uncultured Caudovirales phage]|uniref:Uncharacterized protein n=1 Tax=uncultured Caudovirales phage TaxID=2100421 RepID=A0A6J5L008_9CAUD|nr:hypothetical protein UFOVP84_36 [uncultured Caudovirales phage]
MTDLYYKFLDEQEMLTTLLALGMAYDDQVMQGNHQYAAWVVGEIEGIAGYHYNLRLIDESFDVSALNPYLVVPKNPRCVWS